DELDSIHYATLQILQRTGIKVFNEKALDVFDGGGAKVEKFDGYGIVKLPPYLVEQCAFWAPRTIVYSGRNMEDDYVGEPHRVGFTTFSGCTNIIDPHDRKLRQATKKDCGDIARVCDYLDEICVVERTVISTDSPGGAQNINSLEAVLNNTSKHVFLGADSARALQTMAKMASVCVEQKEVFKNHPIFSAIVCPTSPLTFVENTCDVIMESARLGLGICVLPMSLSGGTSTASLAGALA
ncbi:MAG: Trimethylamine methyltransferase MttB, partial [Desulfobacterales bacterium]|nr:Trimethylamine methyltransferase MttB [Desulfobacterales bacterium]